MENICKNYAKGLCCGNWNEFGICRLTIPPSTLQPCKGHDLETEEEEVKETLKFDTGKPDFTQIPQEALLELAKVFTKGGEKYGTFNYSLGTNYRRYIAAAHRHINQWLRGEDIDEIGTNHLANAAASLLMVLDNQITKKGIDDRNTNYTGTTKL